MYDKIGLISNDIRKEVNNGRIRNYEPTCWNCFLLWNFNHIKFIFNPCYLEKSLQHFKDSYCRYNYYLYFPNVTFCLFINLFYFFWIQFVNGLKISKGGGNDL